MHLIVRNPFGPYARGTHISDPDEVQRILDSPHVNDVIRIAAAQQEKRA